MNPQSVHGENNHKRMIWECLQYGRELTEWEEKFLHSIAWQWGQRGWLTDKQIEILLRIYAEKTPTGSPFGEDSNDARVDDIQHEDMGTTEQRRSWKDKGYED